MLELQSRGRTGCEFGVSELRGAPQAQVRLQLLILLPHLNCHRIRGHQGSDLARPLLYSDFVDYGEVKVLVLKLLLLLFDRLELS